MTDVLEPIAGRPSSRKTAFVDPRAGDFELGGTDIPVCPEFAIDLPIPEDDKEFEFVDGRKLERTMGAESSRVGAVISRVLGNFCADRPVGFVFGSDAHYRCFADPKQIRLPDVSLVALGRFADDLEPETDITIAPDLAVEVISPNELYVTVEERLTDYLAAGSKSVRVVNPASRSVRIHKPDGSARSLQCTDTLIDPDVLPGFSTVVEEFFRPPAGVAQTAPRGSTAPAIVDPGANP